MLAVLVGVQTLCVGVTAVLAYRSSKREPKMKVVTHKVTKFKHYKAGGF